jgi:CheY-like chemotaxis protein
MRLLWIDDEKDIMELCQMILSNQGYDIVTALSCVNVLALIEEASPDIILLDDRMPEMTGIEATKLIKSSPFSHIPIVICSANPETLYEARDAGAWQFVTKPFEIAEIIQVLESHGKEAV